jgi:hypothetical protein
MTCPWQCLLAGLLLAVGAVAAAHEEPGKEAHQHPSSGSAPSTGIRITMEQLHTLGGVPRGWRFHPFRRPGRGEEGVHRAGVLQVSCSQG